jgi:uncharacterized protein (DUF2147 family)
VLTKRFFALMSVLALSAPLAQAAPPSPAGEWTVANGMARIKIDQCGKDVWGVISWEQNPGGQDSNNPDPAKRTRPTLGMPILMGMKPTDSDRWEGEVYNAENGKTYDANIRLKSPDVLQIQGCVLGFLCGGEDWTRYKPEPAAAPTTPAPRGAKPQQPAGVDVCQSVAAATVIPLETLSPQHARAAPSKTKRPAPAH